MYSPQRLMLALLLVAISIIQFSAGPSFGVREVPALAAQYTGGSQPITHNAPPPAKCEFVLGFKLLQSLIPETIGDCKDNVHYNPQNGDALQNTSKGMLVWRKIDNFTAFTDGYRTWVNGPYGVQERLNAERFDWEKDPIIGSAPPSSCSRLAGAVSFEPFHVDADGASYARGTMRNPCDQSLFATVDVFAKVTKDGPVAFDVPTIWVVDLAPGAITRLEARIPTAVNAQFVSWQVTSTGYADWCSDVSGAKCKAMDPWLGGTYQALRTTEKGKALVNAAENYGIRIDRSVTRTGILGRYTSSTKTIIIDSDLDDYSGWVRSAVLAHELQHAVDHATGAWPKTSADCYKAEERAFQAEAAVWSSFWAKRLAPNLDVLHTELNRIVDELNRDPTGFARSLRDLYSGECSG